MGRVGASWVEWGVAGPNGEWRCILGWVGCRASWDASVHLRAERVQAGWQGRCISGCTRIDGLDAKGKCVLAWRGCRAGWEG